MKRKQLEELGSQAVQVLRKKNLSQGHPFMINMASLPADQCYLEFPDGIIQLVVLNRDKKDFEKVRELSLEEQNFIKQSLQLV